MKDALLELMVKLSEAEKPIEIAITLIVDGFLVSGYIVSKEGFMKHSEITAAIEDNVKKAIEKQVKVEAEAENDGERQFIHLKEAKYFAPGQPPIPGDSSLYCRIPLEKVSGFNIGILKAD